MSIEQKKLLLAGSHAATTATATVEEINSRKLNWELSWVGNIALPISGVRFYKIESGKVENKFTRNTISSLLKIPVGFIKAKIAVLKVKPDLILSFGGAAGAECAFWGWVLKIPVIIHEQTSAAGRANIKSSKFAKKIAISRETSRKYFPIEKTILTGDPISKEIIKLKNNKPSREVKTIFITGGSQGSKWINDAIFPLLLQLSKKYEVVWQCGKELESGIKNYESGVKTYGYIKPKKYAEFLKKADIVIARAGSNTVSELTVAKKPCILIPIPWSYLGEQSKNAKYAKEIGLARIIKQSELTSEKLEEKIEKLISDYPKIIKNTRSIVSPDLKASEKLVNLLQTYI